MSTTSQLRSAICCTLILLTAGLAHGQFTPTADTYISTTTPSTNFGAATIIAVQNPAAKGLIRFDLSGIPSTFKSTNVSKATLKLYVSAVTTAGNFSVVRVTSPWAEKTVTANTSPTLGTAIASGIPIALASKNQYVLVDITAAIGEWLNGTSVNNGVALVPSPSVSFAVDTKETTTTSHEPELDIVFNGPAGPAGPQGPPGPVSSVGLSAPSSDFVVTGSPITSSGTLGLGWNVAPSSASTANAIVKRDGSGNFAASGITAGTVTATGVNAQGIAVNSTATFPVVMSASAFGTTVITGDATNTTGAGYGVQGQTESTLALAKGVYGVASALTGTAVGVSGRTVSSNGTGVFGQGSAVSATSSNWSLIGKGVWGDTNQTGSEIGVLATADDAYSFYANNNSATRTTIAGFNSTSSPSAYLLFLASSSGFTTVQADGRIHTEKYALSAGADLGDAGCGPGLFGFQLGQLGMSGCTNYTLLGDSSGNTYLNTTGSGIFRMRNNNATDLVTIDTAGNMNVKGNLSKGGGSFKIDHPLDPANQYLYHSFVESPDMMNVYNGNVTTNAQGVAVIKMPAYFESLNRDFRYQLTVIGQFAQAIVAKELSQGRFTIRTNKSRVKVSWQVTGIRQDAWANAHRIPVEVEKPTEEKGHYLHPELFGATEEQGIGQSRP